MGNIMRSEVFTWTHLGKGLIGSVIGGAVEGVGIGLSTAWKMPKATYHALKALWKTQELGPVLKTTVTPFAVAGGLISPILGVLGGFLHGMFFGFEAGAHEGVIEVPSASSSNIRKYHTEMVDDAIQSMSELASRPPQRYLEIQVIEAFKGLICGTFGAIVTGIGVALSTAVNLPGAYIRATHTIWSGGGGRMLPLQVGAQVLATVLLIVAPALVVLVAVVGGLGIGAARGYTKGLLSALSCFDDVRKYHDTLVKVIY